MARRPLIKPSHRGLFGKKAARAGMSVSAYAHKEAKAKGVLGEEARFALLAERGAFKKKK